MVTRTEYEKQWGNHIDELINLGWNLQPEDLDELRELQRRMKVLVNRAADNLPSEQDC